MSDVKEWAAIICFAALACTIIEMISPAGKMEKMVRFVMGAFMICAMLQPIINITKLRFDFNINSRKKCEIHGYKKQLEDQTVSIAAENLKSLIINELDIIKIKPRKIQIFMDRNNTSSISISKIIIKLDKKNLDRQEEVKDLLNKKFNLQVEIIN